SGQRSIHTTSIGAEGARATRVHDALSTTPAIAACSAADTATATSRPRRAVMRYPRRLDGAKPCVILAAIVADVTRPLPARKFALAGRWACRSPCGSGEYGGIDRWRLDASFACSEPRSCCSRLRWSRSPATPCSNCSAVRPSTTIGAASNASTAPPPRCSGRAKGEAPTRIVNLVGRRSRGRSEEHTSELQSRENLVCRLLLEKKK